MAPGIMRHQLATLLLALGALLLLAMPAQASAAGSISGSVTVPPGVSAEGMCVFAMRIGDNDAIEEQLETAVAGGQYSLTNLTAGYWVLRFSSDAGMGCGSSGLPTKGVGVYLDEGESVTENVTIPRGGSIAGTVSIQGGSYSPQGACVMFNPYDSAADAAMGSVGSDGTYTLTNIAPGDGELYVYSDPGLCESAATQIITARTTVSVFSDITTPANVTVDIGGVITGVLTPAEGALDADRMCVYAYPTGTIPSYLGDGAPRRAISYSEAGLNNGQARYEVTDVPPGTYDVAVDPCLGGDGLARVIQTGIVVAPGAVTSNLNITTPRAGRLGGFVNFGTSSELIACVEAQSQSDPLLRHVELLLRDPDKPEVVLSYNLTGLAAGAYTIRLGLGDAGCLGASVVATTTIHQSFSVTAGTSADAGTYTIGQTTAPAPSAPVAPPAKAPAKPKDPCAGKKTAALAVCRAKVVQEAALAKCAKRPAAQRSVCQVTARAAFALTQATERAKGTLVTDTTTCNKRPAAKRAACRAAATKAYRRAIALAEAAEDLQVGTAQCESRPKGEQKACLASVKKAHARAIKRARR